MPQIIAPSTTGSSIAAFLDAYHKEAQNRRLEEALARQNVLAALQGQHAELGIAREQQQASDTANLRAGLLRLPEIVRSMQTPDSLRAVPGAAPVLDPMGDVGGATAQMPSTVLAPGESTVPVSKVVGGMTPEQSAATLTSPQGTQAMTNLGVVSDKAFEENRRLREASDEYMKLGREAHEAMLAGNVDGYYTKQMAALRAYARAARPDQIDEIQKRINELSLAWKKTRDDTDETKRIGEDMKSVSAAHAAYRTNPTQENLDKLRAATAGVTSKDFRKNAAQALLDAAKSDLAQGDDPIRQVEGLVNKMVVDETTKTGTPPKREMYLRAYQQVKQENPEVWSRAFYELWKTGKVPAEWELAQFGRHVPVSEREVAYEVAAGKGGNPTDPTTRQKFWADYTQALKDLEIAKKTKDSDAQDRITRRVLYQKAVDEVKALRKDLSALTVKFVKMPGEAEAIDKLRGEIAEARKRAVEARSAMIENRDPHFDDLPEPGPDEKPGGGGSVADPGADAKKARRPTPTATVQDAEAEIRRLMSVGHTKQSALSAMRQSGWK